MLQVEKPSNFEFKSAKTPVPLSSLKTQNSPNKRQFQCFTLNLSIISFEFRFSHEHGEHKVELVISRNYII